MPQGRPVVAARVGTRSVLVPALVSVLVGWAVLIALSYVVERPLLLWIAPLLGAHWIATARVSLDCLTLATTGWAIGRMNRSAPLLGVLVFALTLAAFAADVPMGIDLWLLVQLARGALHDVHDLSPLATNAAQQLFLFGSLAVGGLLSRKPVSLFGEPSR